MTARDDRDRKPLVFPKPGDSFEEKVRKAKRARKERERYHSKKGSGR